MRFRTVCFLSVLLPAVACADVIFSDFAIDLSNYTPTPATALPNTILMPPVTSPGTSATYDNCTGCGETGGQALQVLVTTPNTSGNTVFFGLTNNTFTYDPTVSGAIDSISVSIDKNVTFNQPTPGGFTPDFWPLIEQSGIYYLAGPVFGDSFNSGQTTSGFQTLCAGNAAECNSTPFMATDFTQYDFTTQTFGSANPDFSATAAPLEFGIAPIVQLSGQFSFEADYNNLSFDIAPVAATVPEPSTLVPLAFALVLLAFCGLRSIAQSKPRER